MFPVLFHLPAWLPLLAGGGLAGLSVLGGEGPFRGRHVLGALAGMAAGLGLGALMGWLGSSLPVHGYGTMILLGFLIGVWMARRHAPLIGIDPAHCTDMGLWGILAGLTGARVFHVIEFWPSYTPFGERGFSALWGVFKLWEGGLVFYGAFIGGLLAAVIYCRVKKLPVLPFLDLGAPCLIAGQALGRQGCFLRGCCYGRVCHLPWAVRFPKDAPAFLDQYGWTPPLHVSHSLPVHPTQLYASLGAALVALFLYLYWSRRRFDGEVLAYTMLMAGITRFFEEFLRADTRASFPALSVSLSIAQYFALGLLLVGSGWWWHFRRRGTLYAPPPAAA